MILNIRGTNGSGKTHLVRSLLAELPHDVLPTETGDKILGYHLAGPNLRVLGRYDVGIKGGGVDNVTDYLWRVKFPGRCMGPGRCPRAARCEGNSMDAVELQVREWAEAGYHVLFEGLIVTSVWGRWVKLGEEWPLHMLWLDTPLQVCFERTVARNGRVPKGWPGKSSLEDKWKGCQVDLAAAARLGIPHEVLPYENALPRLRELVEGLGAPGPRVVPETRLAAGISLL